MHKGTRVYVIPAQRNTRLGYFCTKKHILTLFVHEGTPSYIIPAQGNICLHYSCTKEDMLRLFLRKGTRAGADNDAGMHQLHSTRAKGTRRKDSTELRQTDGFSSKSFVAVMGDS
jgi:hypothetical protein